MPVRATKRGSARTPLQRDCDVLVCGASFAGLTVARELERSGASVMLVDRYEIGERQTSACAAPTEWLELLDLESSIRQTFGELVVHTSRSTARWSLPFTFSTFDYGELCGLLRDSARSSEFETATVSGIEDGVVLTDRGAIRAGYVVDALGWRRVLSSAPEPIQPPNARLSRGLEVHPPGSGQELELWIDRRYVRAGYSWSFPAGDELRVGVGSFEPRDHVKASTLALARDLALEPDGYQGNWIPHRLRPATDGSVFFVGDSAGHCLPLTAEGIRPAFYFAMALARELRSAIAGTITREEALARYRAFSHTHALKYSYMLAAQHLVGRSTSSAPLRWLIDAFNSQRLSHWVFQRYLEITPRAASALPSPEPIPA
ncbi:MAG: NAD(P)/FAD-dependent oxidoreductase [Solirubrobacteraceae bacterium]|jgi:flavin-dependent dehydrogenase